MIPMEYIRIINKVGSLDKAEDHEELFKNEIVIEFEKDD